MPGSPVVRPEGSPGGQEVDTDLGNLSMPPHLPHAPRYQVLWFFLLCLVPYVPSSLSPLPLP